MTADPQDGLSWGGETDPSHVDGPQAVTPLSRPAHTPSTQPATQLAEKTQTPAALLITYGILGGAYLIYTLGWVVAVTRLNGVRGASSELLSEIMFQFGEFLAIASPALWFAAVFALTRSRKPIVRLLWILVGLVPVLPWPFVLGVWG